MEKIVIGITLDHTFRNIYGKITELYQKFYIDEPTADAKENNEEIILPKLNLPINTNNLMNHIPFGSIEDMNDFIFSEFPLEIFGYSKEVEPGSVQVFNSWINDLPKNVEVVLISNEVGRTKPSTLFFLSKTGFEGNNIKFIDDSVDIFKICDILVTSSEIKTNKPKDKKLIIIEREHNKQLKGDINYNNLFELFSDEKFKTQLTKNKSLINRIRQWILK